LAPGLSGEVVLLELDLRPVVFPSTVMSNTVPRQPSPVDAARSDAPSAHRADRPLPDFQPHSPIEREIERSERASAALAATRALARAAFTDSQLAADDAAADADGDIDTSGWIRTEYAALDHPLASRGLQDDPATASRASAASGRNLAGGTFNPGIASQQGRTFPGAPIGNAQIRTRTGAHARFLQESRHAPRGDRLAGAGARIEPSLAAGAAHYDKPALIPMLATRAAAPVARRPMSAPVRAPAGESFKFALAAGFGAAVVLMGGGLAWNAGLLSHASPGNASLVTAQLATQAESARVLAAAQQEIALAPPAAGAAPLRSNEEVDAALAAAARAAAVPVASVHAAGPSRMVRLLPSVAAALARARAAPEHAPVRGKDGVASAIANAQARADDFLAPGSAASATAPTSELKHEQ
jgi:hypothetical protein